MNQNSRPTAITVICILGFLGVIIASTFLFSAEASFVGSWYPPFLAFSIVVSSISFIGMWLMKKWGVYTYTGLISLNQIVLLNKGLWSFPSLLIPLIVIIIGFTYIKMMS